MARPRGVWSEKRFRGALEKLACERDAAGKQRIENVAEQLLRSAEAGEGWAVTEFANRIDGKPPQAIIGDDDADPISLIAEIRRVIVRPDNPNG
jgi:hypothetical protein